ncbi:MAG: hypothetical protein GX100_04575 [candidate division WS1 bacterium]|jgi:hypothetical protein|nr:hypothetical protein [candidate division WS1 bacterium]
MTFQGWPLTSLALLLLCVVALASPLVTEDGYQFVVPTEPLPAKPWHDHFVDENAKTPEGQPNNSAKWIDWFLQRSLDNQLEKTAAQGPWETSAFFFNWAMWGYLSPDSRFQGDQRMITMSQTWLDTLQKTVATAPTDPEKAQTWQPRRLNSWGFLEYTQPLLEVLHRPDLQAKLGEERVEAFRELVLENVRHYGSAEYYNKMMEGAETYINPAVHPMAVYIHGWILTGEKKYLQMAHRIVHILGRDQLPNGMFPYRYKIYGPRHQEFETMYYHNMDLRGLYLYWWATGSQEAEAIFRKSVPYYPLNLEPPYYFNDGADIWWKDQWRTFWPEHIAMVAAVTGDGENAKIANDMARDGISGDRIDLPLGAHAYQQMGLRQVEEKPVRDEYLIEDPDIRGVRLRFGSWSSTFTTSSFTFTRASAMAIAEDHKHWSALHLARPVVVTSPLTRSDRDYNTLGRSGAFYNAALGTRAAAVATVYSPALTAATWADEQPEAPWQMREVWLLTAEGDVGLIESTVLEANEARELHHEFRFIPSEPMGEGEELGEKDWAISGIRFKVWATDLPFTILERARRSALSAEDRRDWQVTLSDQDRSPLHVALDPPAEGQPKPEVKLPETHAYPAAYSRYSLVQVSPLNGITWSGISRETQGDLAILRAQAGTRQYLVLHNAGKRSATYRTSDPAQYLVASWLSQAVPAPRQGNEVVVELPPGGVAILTR